MSQTAKLFVDGLIIVGYFVVIVTIGLRLGRRDGSLHEFALGGRRVPWWAVMASIIAAETSAATFLGAPGEGYHNKSFAYVQLIIGLIIGRILVGKFFLAPYYRYHVYTVYDYLDIRFGPASKAYVSALFLAMRTLASGTRLFIPSLVIVLAWQLFFGGAQTVSFGTSANQSLWPYATAIIALVIITCIYTAIGGIKAVIWTDVIQSGVMFLAAIVAIATLVYHIAGDSWDLSKAFAVLGDAAPKLKHADGYVMTGLESSNVNEWMAANKLTTMRPLDYVWMILGSQYTLFSAFIASTASSLGTFGTDQDMVQRMLTAETAKKASRSLVTSALADLPIAAAFAFIGILLFAYYQQDPTFLPMSNGKPVNSDVFGSYILNVMPVGVRGFVLAGMFATAMGSLSAALNALATSATNDWYLKYTTWRNRRGNYEPEPANSSITGHTSARARVHDAAVAGREADRGSVTAARWFTLFFAALMVFIAVAFAYAKVRNPELRVIPIVLGVANFIIGPMLGVFLIGMFTRRRGSDLGNIIAVTVSLLVVVLTAGWHAEAARWIGSFELNDVQTQMLAATPTADLPSAFVQTLPLLVRFSVWWSTHVPSVAFTWYGFIGAVVVVAIGIWFPTPLAALQRAARVEAQAAGGDERPLDLRGA